jgi:hypothetical protein
MMTGGDNEQTRAGGHDGRAHHDEQGPIAGARPEWGSDLPAAQPQESIGQDERQRKCPDSIYYRASHASPLVSACARTGMCLPRNMVAGN